MGRANVIGIVGEGKMGTNLFQYIAGFPFEMRWIGSPEADIEKISRAWSKKVLRGLNTDIIAATDAERMKRAVITNDLNALHDCDLIIESITENENAKRELFSKLDRVAPPSCILATNSSSILPSALIPSQKRRSSFIVLHFFYPAALKNIVELVVTEATSEEAIGTAKDFLRSIGRNFLFQDEGTAFLLNRVFLEFQVEAWHITEEGLMTPAGVDNLIRERFFPLGAFECFDVVGTAVMLPSIRNYTRRYPEKEKYNSLLAVLEKMQGEGRRGMRSGKGFFSYGTGSPEEQSAPTPVSYEVIQNAEKRLRTALDNAVERLLSGAGFTTEQFLQGFREYLGF